MIHTLKSERYPLCRTRSERLGHPFRCAVVCKTKESVGVMSYLWSPWHSVKAVRKPAWVLGDKPRSIQVYRNIHQTQSSLGQSMCRVHKYQYGSCLHCHKSMPWSISLGAYSFPLHVCSITCSCLVVKVVLSRECGWVVWLGSVVG